MARNKEIQGDLDGALDLLDQAEHLYNGAFSPNVRPIAARKVRIWVAQGQLDKALGWAREHELSTENELSYIFEFDHITLVRVLLACYQNDQADRTFQEAIGLLERLVKAAEERGGKGSVIEILILQAIAYHAQGDLTTALDPLQKALTMAEPQGYVHMFIDEDPPMAQLLREALARGIKPGYTGRLLAAIEDEARAADGSPVLPTAQILVELLSQREVEVLRLIARGFSNRVIGERLFLALDTVKGHNRKIFDKLQVQNRTEAAARARELGLL
jgi:LuxR family maltose regulon positive regulatory protein